MPWLRVVIAINLGALAACRADQPSRPRPPPGPATFSIEIHQPGRLTGVATGDVDPLGRSVRASCVSCHSLREAAPLPTSTAELNEFHQGLQFAHGELTCASCHLAGPTPSLRRADGERVDLRDAMVLCRQCHGPQARDYDHGAHGGMSGSWDLSTGGRTRNHCVDCHDPHAPRFQPSWPVLPPRDRGITAAAPRRN